MYSGISVLSGEQIRAARALTRIDQADLAALSGLSLETIKRLEGIRGPVGANSRTLEALLSVFAGLGVSFDRGEDGRVGVSLTRRNDPAALSDRSSASEPDVRPTEDPAARHRLIYYSTADLNAEPFQPLLEQLRVSGGRCKAGLDVSGMVYAYDGRFLGVLEGARDSVRQVMGQISCDPRHRSISVISDQPVAARRFPDWTIGCGLFPTDKPAIGDEPALKDGFRPEVLSAASALGLLSVMRDLAETFPRKALTSRNPCPLAQTCLDRVCAQRAA